VIIGPNFIWLHFPKCAGSHTEQVLRNCFYKNLGITQKILQLLAIRDPEVIFDPIDPKNVIWHENVLQREQRTGINLDNKAIICNFRRLPSWMISRIQYEEKRSGNKTTKDEYITGRLHEQNGSVNFADNYLKKYSSRPVTSWIRTEYIRDDFEKAFSPFLDLSSVDLSKKFRQTTNVTKYERDLRKWFTPEDLERLYCSCPLWRDQEIKLYGDLIAL
jgi:hypothetical protein